MNDDAKQRQIRKPRFTVEQIEDALRASLGIQAAAAKMLDVHRNTISTYIKAHPELRDVIDEAIQTRIDRVEAKIQAAAEAGDTTAMIFLLKTKGKKRGYAQGREAEHYGDDEEEETEAIDMQARIKERAQEYVKAAEKQRRLKAGK